MSDKIDSSNWTGDVEGRARTQGPFNTPEVRREIVRALLWGLLIAAGIGLYGFVLGGLI